MIKSSLKDIKAAVKKIYPKPYTIDSYDKDKKQYLTISTRNNQKFAEFEYSRLDGALISGGCFGDEYKSEYNQHFKSHDDPKYLDYFQNIVNLFYKNSIVKELIPEHSNPKALPKSVLYWDDYYGGMITLTKQFNFLETHPFAAFIEVGYQYYVNDEAKIVPRTKIKFEFTSSGSLTLYYDYSTESLRLGYIIINDQNQQSEPSLLCDYQMNQELTFEDLEKLLNKWMLEIACRLNDKIMKFYQIDESIDVFEPSKAIDHLKLLKIRLF